MADNFIEVRPGDIISSDLINEILRELSDMKQRLVGLEALGQTVADPVAITGFDPPDEVAVGQKLTIEGRGFSTPPLVDDLPTNTLRLDDTQITSFVFPNSEQALSFIVPSALVGEGPREVTIRLGNERGEAQPRTYRLLPPVVPQSPAPTITKVFPLGQPSQNNILIIGGTTVIQGTNFPSDPDDILVRLLLSRVRRIIYPGSGDPPLKIDVDSATQFKLHVPLIDEVSAQKVLDLEGGSRLTGTSSIVLSVRVAGNPTAVSRTVQARLPSRFLFG